MRLVALAASLTLCLTAAPAVAKTIVVAPGPGTPLQDAIDAAAPGDRIKLRPGTYPEAISIDRRLVVDGDDRATIDAGCATASAVTITADRVQLRRISIQGGSDSSVLVSDADRVTLGVSVFAKCRGVQRAITARRTTRLLVQNGVTTPYNEQQDRPAGCSSPELGEHPFAEADVVIESAPPAANNRIVRFAMCGSRTAVLVTGSLGSAPGRPAVTVLSSDILYPENSGVKLVGADDVAILGNFILGPASGGATGILLDATSDDNVVQRNDVVGCTPDVLDLGTSNCWRGNSFGTGSVPSLGCP